MRKALIITLLLLFSSTAVVFAQVSLADEGSVYSQYGVGSPVQTGSSNAIGAGVWGVSDIEPFVANVSNPAIWGYTVYGLASGGAQVKNFHEVDNFGKARHTVISVNHFQLQVPIKKNKLGLSVAFTPYTRISYTSIQSKQKLKGTNVIYRTQNATDGGVDRYEVGVGWKINKYIAIGYAASVYHLSVINKYTTIFSDKAYTPVSNKIITSGSAFGNRFGIYLSLPSLGDNGQGSLSFGLTANLPVTLNAQQKERPLFVSGVSEDNQFGKKEIATGNIHLPFGLTAGVTYKPSSVTAVSIEGRFQSWSNYENDLKQKPKRVIFKNRLKVGVGFQYFPVYSGSNSFLSNFKYRIGLNYDTGYLNIKGEDITALKVTAGLGIMSPSKLQGFKSSIDINFYYKIQGTKEHNLVKEHIFGVKLTLNLAELFFYRPKLQ